MKSLRLSTHAGIAMAQRSIKTGWVEQAVFSPDWVEVDPQDETVDRRFAAIYERGGRFLRVACRETPEEIFVISCFLDRKARRPK